MRMPSAVISKLPAEVKENAVFALAAQANWEALCACYQSEEAAIEAVEINFAVVLPYGAESVAAGFYELDEAVDRSENIAGSFEVLESKLEGDELREVLSSNPGVLGCVPSQLEKASASDIKRAAAVASAAENVFGPARRFLQSTSWWDEGAANVAKEREARESESGGGGAAAAADDEEEELLLPTVEIEGVEYMYDRKGAYNGVEQVLLTLGCDPVGVWNPLTCEAEPCDFLPPDE